MHINTHRDAANLRRNAAKFMWKLANRLKINVLPWQHPQSSPINNQVAKRKEKSGADTSLTGEYFEDRIKSLGSGKS